MQLHANRYVCMYVCMHACMCLCVCVCVCKCVCLCVRMLHIYEHKINIYIYKIIIACTILKHIHTNNQGIIYIIYASIQRYSQTCKTFVPLNPKCPATKLRRHSDNGWYWRHSIAWTQELFSRNWVPSGKHAKNLWKITIFKR